MSEDENEGEATPPSFVALIHEDGISVDVMDVKGKLIQYSIRENDLRALKGGNHQKVVRLCFSSHGMGNVADELLTPCFDEDGEHGEPEESCWCGEDDPHIHAHIYDPSICNDIGSSCSKYIPKKTIDLSFLAKVTLYPVEKDNDVAAVAAVAEEHHKASKTISNSCCHGKKSCTKKSSESSNDNNDNFCAGESCCSTATVTTDHGGSCCNDESLADDENMPLLQSNTSCCAKNKYETFTSDNVIHEKLPLIHMPVNESLPNECNAKALHQKFSQYSNNSSSTSSKPKTMKRKRIMRVKVRTFRYYILPS